MWIERIWCYRRTRQQVGRYYGVMLLAARFARSGDLVDSTTVTGLVLAPCKSGPRSCKPDDKRYETGSQDIAIFRRTSQMVQHTAAARARNGLHAMMNRNMRKRCHSGIWRLCFRIWRQHGLVLCVGFKADLKENDADGYNN